GARLLPRLRRRTRHGRGRSLRLLERARRAGCGGELPRAEEPADRRPALDARPCEPAELGRPGRTARGAVPAEVEGVVGVTGILRLAWVCVMSGVRTPQIRVRRAPEPVRS